MLPENFNDSISVLEHYTTYNISTMFVCLILSIFHHCGTLSFLFLAMDGNCGLDYFKQSALGLQRE